MVDCFFGENIKDEKIEGKGIFQFAKEIMGESMTQRDIFYFLLGLKFINLGIRKKDRVLNRKIAIYEAWGKKVIEDKIAGIKDKAERGELGKKPNDLIEAIVRNSMKEKKENELGYDNQSIFDEFRTFFFAGVDTTSNYLGTMIYLVVKHPEVERKVREEIEEFMREDDYSYENLKNFTYIDNVEKETTRFYGPVNLNFLRVALKDHHLKNVLIKKGTLITNPMHGLHFS